METILDLEDLSARCRAHRAAGRTVVWTNGCFDLVHAGHVASLEAAAALGDVLVVGLNADASVARLKGPERPWMSQENRGAVLAGLSSVDHVLVFDEDDCENALSALRPDVYAQGGGYTLETIHQGERRIVEGYGGRIAFLPHVQGESTTELVGRVRGPRITTAAFALILDDAGRLLMVRDDSGVAPRWGVPGGTQEASEALVETVVRECQEETGLTVTVGTAVGVVEWMREDGFHLQAHFFRAVAPDTPPSVNASDDIGAVSWMDRAALAAEPGYVVGREMLLRWMDDPSAQPVYERMLPGQD